jgi:hypothetical protein
LIPTTLVPNLGRKERGACLYVDHTVLRLHTVVHGWAASSGRKRMSSDGRSSDSNTSSGEFHTFVEYSCVRLFADTVATSGIFEDSSGVHDTPYYSLLSTVAETTTTTPGNYFRSNLYLCRFIHHWTPKSWEIMDTGLRYTVELSFQRSQQECDPPSIVIAPEILCHCFSVCKGMSHGWLYRGILPFKW